MSYKRVVIAEYGGPEVLQMVEESALPEPGAGEVRVKVQVASASFSDLLVRRGLYPFLGKKPPLTPGYDLIGVVDVAGPGVTGLAPGQRVAALTKIGAYTEYLTWPADRLVPVPDDLDSAGAVSLVLSTMTAYQMFHRVAKVPQGGTILVHGAGGAVGSALLELGRLHGCTMIATASAASRAVAEGFGATVIDYAREDFVARTMALTNGAGVDAAFDAISGKHIQQSFKTLKRGGVLVPYGMLNSTRGDKEFMPYYFAWMAVVNLLPNGKRVTFYSIYDWYEKHYDWFAEDLQVLFGLLRAGEIAPVIQERIPFVDVKRAHEMLDAGGIKGKLVLIMDEA